MNYNFQKFNNITGWVLFVIATTVYFLTVEDTASYWDCGEFIAVSYKLEVPHPPGAPLFLLIGRLFSFLAFGNVESVAYWINIASVLSSGFTILFLFWSITLFGRKILKTGKNEETPEQVLLLMGAGIIGSLAYTFSDSFWFSAVEAEVYAMSSFFTAFVVWAVLKWDLIEDESTRNKWMILVAYMVGLSIGVHLLNLVTLPALALIVYFRNHTPTRNGIIATLLVSGVIVIAIMEGLITGLPDLAGKFEIFFVNGLSMPFGSGIIFFMVLIFGSLTYGIYYSIKHNKSILNTALLCLTFIMIGYSSYTLVVIRTQYNPPIDENNPDNIISFVSYLKREQYGSRPLFKGPYFTAELVKQEQGAPVYTKGKEKYEITDYKLVNEYDPKQSVVFPRAWSSDSRHQSAYRDILGLSQGEVPTFGDNLAYLFKHQLGHMYMRYFLWNFVGRESDEQNAGWLTPWESFEDVPEAISRNKARNNFWMLPFILGLLGLFYQFNKDKKNFSVVLLLFFLMGVALVLYLNSPPIEPRERDYIYAGSFYAFAMWIGFGVMALYELIKKFFSNKLVASVAVTVACLSVPLIMAIEGWDDHDRSDRYFSVDSAVNLLQSLAPNAILFTGGDNDTFPLWYAQEVEGVRTDVRVIVLSYFNTDWYIEQMTRQAYESAPLPFSLDKSHYKQGGLNDYIPMVENPNIKGNAINLKQYMKLVQQNYKGIQIPTSISSYNSIPSNTLFLNVDTTDQRIQELVPESKKQYMTDKIMLRLKSQRLFKSDLMILDLIANGDWKRPMYFNNTSLQGVNFDVNPYVIQEGNAYRFAPVERPDRNAVFADTEVMYSNVMNKFKWRELNNPGVYYNPDYRGMVQNHRFSLNSLTEELINEGKLEKARNVVEKNLEWMPDNSLMYDYSSVETISLLIQLGETERALEIAQTMGDRSIENLTYIEEKGLPIDNNFQRNMIILRQLSSTMQSINQTELAKKFNETFEIHYKRIN